MKRKTVSGEEIERKEQKVMNKFDLERDDLKFRCPSNILNSIAGEIVDDWNMIGRELDVSTKVLKSIPLNRFLNSPEEQAVAMLDAWAEEKGREATCLKLANVLLKRNKISTLENFCELVKLEVDKMKM